jgi:Flp pilus assembly protein TadG
VWFFTVTIYFLFLASFLSVDVSKSMIAQNQVELAAESAALAGAATAQLNVGTYYLDEATARQVTEQTLAAEIDQSKPWLGATPDADFAPGTAVIHIVVSPTASSPSSVTVTISYTVPKLLFLGFFGVSSPTYTASSSAFLCIPTTPSGPGALNTASGDCAPPTGN